jgi:hypothetical protein
MPTHPLQIFVLGVPANREVHITLLNPHGNDEECEVHEEGSDQPVTVCSYRVVRGFSAPYYFLITISPARDVGVATCAVNPARVLVHRLDRYVRFEIERVRVEEGGSCTYIAREQQTPPPT